jgi:hypothetical protein
MYMYMITYRLTDVTGAHRRSVLTKISINNAQATNAIDNITGAHIGISTHIQLIEIPIYFINIYFINDRPAIHMANVTAMIDKKYRRLISIIIST